MITVEQIRAARAMLHLGQKEVAARADISIATYNNIERGVQTNPHMGTMQSIQQAFEREGIEFINESMGRVGLLLKAKRKNPEQATILIVDDSKSDRTLYRDWLEHAEGKQYQVIEAASAETGFDVYVEQQPDCVVLDFMMYGADGFQMLAKIKQQQIELPPIIFVTGMHNEILEDNAKAQGVYAYLNKQYMNRSDLCDAVEQALERGHS